MVVPRQHQGQVGAARGLVLGAHHLAVPEDGKSGGAAADVHDDAVLNLVDGVGCAGLIQHGGDLEPRALRHVLVGARAGFRSGGHGDGAVEQLRVQTLLQLLLQLPHDVQRAGVVHHHAVLQHPRRLLFAGDGVILLIQHHQGDIGGAQVHAHLEPGAHGAEGGALGGLDPLHIGVDPIQIHHSDTLLLALTGECGPG